MTFDDAAAKFLYLLVVQVSGMKNVVTCASPDARVIRRHNVDEFTRLYCIPMRETERYLPVPDHMRAPARHMDANPLILLVQRRQRGLHDQRC